MLSRTLRSFLKTNNTGFTKLVQNTANIQAISHFHTAIFSRLRPSNKAPNIHLPTNLQVAHTSKAVYTRSFSSFFSFLFLGSQETQEKIIKAQNITQGNEQIYVDECKIRARADGEIQLYTTGLVYCTGILMIGAEKVGMAHIHGKGIEFMKNMFDAIQPHQLIIYASNGVSEHSSGIEFYVGMMENLEFLKSYAKESKIPCKNINFGYSSYGAGLFYRSNEGQDDFFTMNSKEMKKLNQTK